MIIASGFGRSSQWFRNLQADPRCRVWIGFDRDRPATARVLTPQESAAVLDRYRREHPKAYAELAGVIEESTGLPIDQIPYLELTLDR